VGLAEKRKRLISQEAFVYKKCIPAHTSQCRVSMSMKSITAMLIYA